MPVPTPRLFILLGLAAPLSAIGGPTVLVAVVIVVLTLVIAVVDWFLAGDARRIAIERRLASDKFSLGAGNPVALVLHNATARRQRLVIRDVPPPGFILSDGPLFTFTLGPDAHATVTYRAQPVHRGDAAFGDLYVRADGPLRLVRRTRRLRDTGQTVRIFPDIRELGRMDLLVRRGLDLSAATHPIRAPGASREFERVRDYVTDDDFRLINWKATARRGQTMVNAFEAERSQNLVIMLDLGRTMAAVADSIEPEANNAAVRALTKLDYALNTALLLAFIASRRGDHVAVLAYADDIRTFLPPRRGRQVALEFLSALYNVEPEPVEPDHARAFDFLNQRHLRRSLVVLFTDVVDRQSSLDLVANVQRAARQHVVVCVTLADPNVRRPAESRPVDAPSLYAKMVAQNMLADRAALLADLSAHGILSVDVPASALQPQVIKTYLDVKERGRV